MQAGAHFPEAIQVPLERVCLRDHDRVKAPVHAARAEAIRQLREGIQDLALGRQPLFYVAPVGGDRKREVVAVAERVQPVELVRPRLFAQHGRRVLRPEHDAVDNFRRKAQAAELPRVPGVGHEQVSCFQPPHKPVGIEGRYVRPAACADNHAVTLVFFVVLFPEQTMP